MESTANRMVIYEENPINRSSKELLRRPCIRWLGGFSATFLILVVAVIVLSITFKFKQPDMMMNSIHINGWMAQNMSATADISVKNPNAASFKYNNSTAILSYRDKTVGEGWIPAGRAGPKETVRMNVTFDVFTNRLFGDPNVMKDLFLGNVTVRTHTKMDGRVNLLNVFKRHAEVVMNCTITMSVTNYSILSQSCKKSIKL